MQVKTRIIATTALAAILGASPALAQSAPIVQPGAPGEASRTLSAKEAIAVSGTRFAPGDIAFMRDMITHHQQAVEMRSEEHTSELQSLMRISYAVFCLKKKTK